MKKKLYAVYDKQSEIYGNIFPSVNDTLAKRAYDNLASDPNSDLHKYPQDYKLYHLGEFDSKSGELISDLKSLS